MQKPTERRITGLFPLPHPPPVSACFNKRYYLFLKNLPLLKETTVRKGLEI